MLYQAFLLKTFLKKIIIAIDFFSTYNKYIIFIDFYKLSLTDTQIVLLCKVFVLKQHVVSLTSVFKNFGLIICISYQLMQESYIGCL